MSPFRHFRPTLLLSIAGLTLTACLPAVVHADPASQAKSANYNFSYKIAGDRSIAPVQVFDNGARTYIQFKDMNVLPAIFADTPLGLVLLKPNAGYDVEPPYVIIRSIEPELVLTLNKHKATISYQGPITEFVSRTPVMFGAQQPVGMSRDPVLPVTPTEFKRSQTLAAASAAKPEPGTTVTEPQQAPVGVWTKVSDSATVKPAASTPLLATGLAETTRIDPVEAAPVHWTIARGESISQALRKWCKQSPDYTLAWEAPELIAQADIDLPDMAFEKSVTLVIEALNRSSASGTLHAQFMRANHPKILRVTE